MGEEMKPIDEAKRLQTEIAQWIITANRSELPYEFHSKVIINKVLDVVVDVIWNECEKIDRCLSEAEEITMAVNKLRP